MLARLLPSKSGTIVEPKEWSPGEEQRASGPRVG